jgi:2-dehydropantoate 2-reductase
MCGVKHALVLVKAWQTERAAAQLKGMLAEDGLAVTLQNGLGNRERSFEAWGLSRVALGVTTTGATLLGPGLVKAGGEGTISIERNPALGPLEAASDVRKIQCEYCRGRTVARLGQAGHQRRDQSIDRAIASSQW